jgi:hypothetical protein
MGVSAAPTTRGAGAPAAVVTGGRPSLVREILLVVFLFLVYRLGRLAITGHDTLAISNAWWVWDVERTLRLPDEELLQDWALQWPDLLRAANWYYVTVHFPVTAVFLAWGWWRRPPAEYRWARRLITVLTALALVVHVLMPLAPPRMLSSLGFLDTMAVFGPTAYGDSTTTIANQFAAMPSLHVGWALLIAVVIIYTAKTRWRWLTLLHPLVTVVVVVATANHYWIDAIAAAVLLGVALALTPLPDGPAPAVRLWRRAQAVSTRRTISPVGAVEPPAGSTVRAMESLGAMSSTSASSSPPRPRVPAERAEPSRSTHS